ncbi:YceH family protein [Verrucomicrobium sp. BvORR106]|uniref:YceH family protein n=1 Tax=Verrucomicrobium sp. BvORR106 TaxID=1403819 RepID=UPI00068F2CAD|nr:YceH family protein [Verrucomicrobium sp. BvORR106]
MDMDTLPDASDSESPVEAPALIPLTAEQVRVLGCLIEKEATTPEAYPLTLNALVNACNQTTNREPVVRYDEDTVLEALDGLKRRGYVLQLTLVGARVQKYKHTLDSKFGFLTKPTIALLAALMLRGVQTSGELRQRTERLHVFADIPAVEHELHKLIDYPGHPLAVQFAPGGGRKTVTFAHLLSGLVEPGVASSSSPAVAAVNVSPTAVYDADWRGRMEQELASLRAEVAELRSLIAPGSSRATQEEADSDLPDTGSRYIP